MFYYLLARLQLLQHSSSFFSALLTCATKFPYATVFLSILWNSSVFESNDLLRFRLTARNYTQALFVCAVTVKGGMYDGPCLHACLEGSTAAFEN